jgi:hypothetical protein
MWGRNIRTPMITDPITEIRTAPAEKSLILLTFTWSSGWIRSRNFSIWELINSRASTVKIVKTSIEDSMAFN